MLYNVTASRGTRATFCTPAVPAHLSGHATPQGLVKPDKAALRDALPPQWRKALDRVATEFWFDAYDNGKPAYLTLHFPHAESVTLVATLV